MKFRSEIHPVFPENIKINPEHILLLNGSCFSTEMGKRFYESGWKCCINPCGIYFHPVVMGKKMLEILRHQQVKKEPMVPRDNYFYSLHHHSDIRGRTEQALSEKIQHAAEEWYRFLQRADRIFFTWGTAYYYHHLSTGTDVANCHKLPQSEFEKRLSEPQEILSVYEGVISEIRKYNPRAVIFVTVSPVRYLRHGIVENTLSKSILIYAAQQLVRKKLCYYFPSYELIAEDLKDYRFYKADLMHPSDQAVDYVWEKLIHSLMTDTSKVMAEKVSNFYTMLKHEIRDKEVQEKKEQWDAAIARAGMSCVGDYPWLSEREEIRLYKADSDK